MLGISFTWATSLQYSYSKLRRGNLIDPFDSTEPPTTLPQFQWDHPLLQSWWMSPKASSYISNDSAQLRVRGRPIVRVFFKRQALSFKLLTYMPYLNLKLDTISVSRGGNLQGDALDTTSMSSKPLLVKLPSGTLTNHNYKEETQQRWARVF